MKSPTLTWHRSPDGAFYTTPRKYTIEPLQNGKFYVFHYGPNTSSLHDSLTDAYRACGTTIVPLWIDGSVRMFTTSPFGLREVRP